MSQSDFNGPPQEVSAIHRKREACLNTVDPAGSLVGNHTYGAYAFYHYDGEPSHSAVLNEKDISPTYTMVLPTSYRRRIVPDRLFEERCHPDVRIARRAATIASLAKVISERQVSTGLRRTLVTQALRLERLARQRMEELSSAYPIEAPREETGDGPGKDTA